MQTNPPNSKSLCKLQYPDIEIQEISTMESEQVSNEKTAKEIDHKNDTQVGSSNSTDNTIEQKSEKSVKTESILFPEWLKGHGSDENLLMSPKKHDLLPLNSPKPESLLKNKNPLSDSVLVTSKSSHPSGLSKILQWDPWHKIVRKNKKDKYKKKTENCQLELVDCTEGPNGPKSNLKPETHHVEPEVYEQNLVSNMNETLSFCQTNEQKLTKLQKAVRFQTEVMVVYYASDQILGEVVEPLKKELEQQERNKELRKEFSPETVSGLKTNIKKSASDYMASWYKK